MLGGDVLDLFLFWLWLGLFLIFHFIYRPLKVLMKLAQNFAVESKPASIT